MSGSKLTTLPTLPLRAMVVYPHGVHPLFVGTKSSIQALEAAMSGDKQVLLVTKRNAEMEDPGQHDVFPFGTVSTVLQLLKLPDNTVKVLIEGGNGARVTRLQNNGEHLVADAEVIEEERISDVGAREVITGSIMAHFEAFVQSSKNIPQEFVSSVSSIDDPGRLIDTIAAQLPLTVEDKQIILETFDLDKRKDRLIHLLETQVGARQIDKKVRGRVKKQMEKSQREYYLNEQIKAIQKELGDMDDIPNELDDLSEKINLAGMPSEAKGKAIN